MESGQPSISEPRRPLGITVTGIIIIFLAISTVLVVLFLEGVSSLVDEKNPKALLLMSKMPLKYTGFLRGVFIFYGLLSIVNLISGINLVRGKNWARKITIVSFLVIISSEFILSQFGASSVPELIIAVVLSIITYNYLNKPHVKAYFGSLEERNNTELTFHV